MGATSSRRTDIASTSSPTLPNPFPTFSSCTTPSRTSSSISPTSTPHTSRSPSIIIPQHVKGKTSSPLSQFSSRIKRVMYRDSSLYQYQHTHAWYENENSETNISIINHEYHDESSSSSQYRQYQSTSTPRLHGMEGADHSPLTLILPQPVITVPATSRTIHIQPNPRLSTYFSRYAQDQSSWLSLEWILATRSATHGLFDAYPYHVFDSFLLRTDPTFRPCLSFLHAEQSFRDKWMGWSPCPAAGAGAGGDAWKISIIVAEAKTLYQNYLIPIISFLSPDIISRLEDIGLYPTSIDPNQDSDVTPFFHGDVFSPAVHEIMHSLRIGPFQSFIQTRQYQELGGPMH